MPCDMPSVSYMALYIISMHVINTNSRTSTHWKLNLEAGKVQTAVAAGGTDGGADDILATTDPLMNILTNKVSLGNGGWKLEAEDTCSENCQKHLADKGENDSVSVKDNHTSSPEHSDRLDSYLFVLLLKKTVVESLASDRCFDSAC